MFVEIISERFYHAYSYTTTLFSIVANSLLICIILSNQMNHVGAYRWLLFSFATVDILISLVHSFMLPATYMTEFGFIFFGYRFLDMSTAAGVACTLCWTFLFYQSAILLAFHYVYRYVIIFKPGWLSWFQRNPWRNWTLLAVIVDLLYAGSVVAIVGVGWYPNDDSRQAFAPFLKEAYGIDLYSKNMPGYLAFTYWIRQEDGRRRFTPAPVFSLVAAVAIIFTAVAVIFFCLIRILREMRRTANTERLQSTTRRMQRTLIRALLWQTIIPIIVSFIPAAITLFLPILFGISVRGLPTWSLMTMQLFPIIDPLLIIFFVTGFRVPLPKILKISSFVLPVTVDEVSMTTIEDQSSSAPRSIPA